MQEPPRPTHIILSPDSTLIARAIAQHEERTMKVALKRALELYATVHGITVPA